MRALRFHAARDVRVEQVDDPPEPGVGEVLVAPVVCGVCGTDLHEYAAGPMRTTVDPDPLTGGRVPQILGHEFAGEVLAVGDGVASVLAGDRVSVMPLVTCGHCPECRAGRPQLCALRAAVGLRHPWGGMAERALVTESQVTALPDDVSWEQGALIEPLAVSATAVDAGRVAAGDSVLVTGFGPIGALAALAAEAGGAGEVIVSEPHPDRAALARSLGFDVIDPLATDVAAACQERRAGGFHVAVECSGRPDALVAALAAMRPGGRVVQAGLIDTPVEIDVMTLMLRGITLVGSVGYGLDAWPGLVERIRAGLPADRIVTGRVPLVDAVGEAFEPLASGRGGDVKVLVEIGAHA
jgi:(R,R)-butanediol dehydrogenase/meso-butanediol dehydrogenase/diacetyl reductase